MDHDVGVLRLIKHILIIIFLIFDMLGPRVVMEMNMRLRVDQDEYQLFALIVVSSNVVEALDLLSHHQLMIVRVGIVTLKC